MFLPFFDRNWCCLSLMWNQLCQRVFLSPVWFNQGLRLFLNRATPDQGLDLFFLISWMILLLIWIGLKILKWVIMPGHTPPSKLSKLNPFSVQNRVSGDPNIDSRRSRLEQISALFADPERVILDLPSVRLSPQK